MPGTMIVNERDRRIRSNIRKYLENATREDLFEEYQLSLDMGDVFRAGCVRELIMERPPVVAY